MNKQTLIFSSRNQRRLNARLTQPRKEGEQHAGAPTANPGGSDNNTGGQGGNQGAGGTGTGESNNTGDAFDAEAFWRGPAQAGGTGNSGESATGNSGQQSGSDTQQQNPNGDLNTQLATQLQNMSFGQPIFDAGIAEEINGGNFEGANKRIQESMQQAVRQALAMNVQILRPFAEQMMTQIRDEFGQTLSSRDNNDQLVKDFPAARDPRVAPGIKTIFDQALKNTGNDRVKAVAQTKQMLAVMANVTGGDLGLNVAPRGSEDTGAPPTVTNWLDELTGR